MDKLFQIHKAIQEKGLGSNTDGALFGIHGGYVLFYMHLFKLTGDNNFFNLAIQKLRNGKTAVFTNASYCSGLAGNLFLLEFLRSEAFLEIKKETVLSSSDRKVYEWAMQQFKLGRIDFLHEGLGALYYLIYKYENGNSYLRESILDLIDLLFKNLVKRDEKIIWSHSRNGEINLGVSHGIISIFYILALALSLHLINEEQKALLKKSIRFIIDSFPITDDEAVYPFKFNSDTNVRDNCGMLAWCYGDLGNAIILKNVADYTNDSYLLKYAIRLAENTTSRSLKYIPNDTGLCHGTAGIYIIYQRLYEMVGNNKLKGATRHWFQLLNSRDISELSTSFVPMEVTSIDNYTFLEGLTGAGLALMYNLQSNNNWSKILLI